MKRLVLSFLATAILTLGLIPNGMALEILRWERLPLSVPLVVGHERVIFIDRTRSATVTLARRQPPTRRGSPRGRRRCPWC